MPEPKETKPKAKKITRSKRRRAPGRTLEGREKQLVQQAIDLAEKQIQKGTVSAQVLSHFLKLGSESEKLAREKIRHENQLLKARTEALASQKRIEELYEKALSAMREYQGNPERNFDGND